MPKPSLTARIERELERVGIEAAVEDSDGALVLSGQVDSVEQVEAARDIVSRLAPGRRLDNNLEVELTLPETIGELTSHEPSESDLPNSLAELRAEGGELDPDFTDQRLLTDPVAAAGPSDSEDGFVQDGDEVYFPPTDPVITVDRHGRAEVLGRFEPTAMDQLEVPHSASDGQLGDEAIADTIRRALREDAATTDLEIDVVVRQGIVHLRGTVPSLDDAENAEDVASRVEGVREVLEELEVSTV